MTTQHNDNVARNAAAVKKKAQRVKEAKQLLQRERDLAQLKFDHAVAAHKPQLDAWLEEEVRKLRAAYDAALAEREPAAVAERDATLARAVRFFEMEVEDADHEYAWALEQMRMAKVQPLIDKVKQLRARCDAEVAEIHARGVGEAQQYGDAHKYPTGVHHSTERDKADTVAEYDGVVYPLLKKIRKQLGLADGAPVPGLDFDPTVV